MTWPATQLRRWLPWTRHPHRDVRIFQRQIAFPLLLAFGMAAGTFLQAALGVLASFLIADFQLSRSSFGALVALFSLGGAVLAPGMGRIVDRFGGRRLLITLFLLVSVGIFGVSTAPSYPILAIIVSFTGIGLALANPTTNKLLALRVDRGSRGLTMGIKQSGGSLAFPIAGLTLPLLAGAIGWRFALALIGIFPLLGAVVSLRLPRDAKQRTQQLAPINPQEARTVRWLISVGFLMAAGMSALVSFLPLYAQETGGFSATGAGMLAAILGAASFAARIMWGWKGENVSKVTSPLLLVAIFSALAVSLIIMGENRPWLLVIGTLLAGATLMAWHAVGWIILLTTVNEDRVGSMSGKVLVGNLIGFAISPYTFGTIVDHAGSYAAGWIFVLGLCSLTLILVLFWHLSEAAR